MLLGISDTTHRVPISIHVSLINANSRQVTNVGASLIDSENNNNDCGRDWKNCTLTVKC